MLGSMIMNVNTHGSRRPSFCLETRDPAAPVHHLGRAREGDSLGVSSAQLGCQEAPHGAVCSWDYTEGGESRTVILGLTHSGSSPGGKLAHWGAQLISTSNQ